MDLRTGIVALGVAIEIALGIAVQIVRFHTIDAAAAFTVCTSAATATTATATTATTTAAAFAIGRIIACRIRCLAVRIRVGAAIGMRFGHDDLDRVRRCSLMCRGLRCRCRGFGNRRDHGRSRGGCGRGGQRLRRGSAFVLTRRALLPLGRRAVLLLCSCTRRPRCLVLRLLLLLLGLLWLLGLLCLAAGRQAPACCA